jgi:hypothetical protein
LQSQFQKKQVRLLFLRLKYRQMRQIARRAGLLGRIFSDDGYRSPTGT